MAIKINIKEGYPLQEVNSIVNDPSLTLMGLRKGLATVSPYVD